MTVSLLTTPLYGFDVVSIHEMLNIGHWIHISQLLGIEDLFSVVKGHQAKPTVQDVSRVGYSRRTSMYDR